MERIYLSLCPAATVLGIGIIVYALLNRSIMPERAIYLIVLLTLFALCFTLFLRNLLRGEHLAFESNWGGLGGGLSGWTLSQPVIFLLLAIGSLGLLVIAFGTENPQTDVRERYRAALNLAAQKGIQFNAAQVVRGKLVLTGTAPSATDVNAFWDQVKLANPIYDDIDAQFTFPAARPSSAGAGSAGSANPSPTGAPPTHPNPSPVK